MFASDHPVGDNGGEERLDRRKERYGRRGRDEMLHSGEIHGWDRRGRQNRVPIVSTGRWNNCTTSVERTSATRGPGILCETCGQSMMIKREPIAIAIENGFTRSRCRPKEAHFSIKSAGTAPICNPRKSLTCDEKMMSAIPLVNPTMTGYGMNLIAEPNRAKPIIMRMMPAMIVAMINPFIP